MATDAIDFRLDWGRGPFFVSKEREALRQRIVAEPRDDALRQRYAELAITEGDPRGEYVRLALCRDSAGRLTKRAIDEAMEDLRARYGGSIYSEWCSSSYGRRLGGMLSERRRRLNQSPYLRERGGFAYFVRGDRAMDATLDELLSLAPLETWDFVGGRKKLEVSVRVGDMPRVDEVMPDVVSLSLGGGVDEAGLDALARLPKLENLDIAYRVPKRAAELFRRPDTFVALRSLSFFECAPDPVAIAELAQRVKLERLSMELTRGLPDLVAALDGAPLEELSLNGYVDGNVELDFTPLDRLRLPNLHTLRLTEYEAGPGLTSLARSPTLETIDTLRLDVGIEDDLMAQLVEQGLFEGIRDLTLLWNRLGSEGLCALAKHDKAPALERLIFRGGNKEEGIRALLERMTSLVELDIGGCSGFQPLSWYRELTALRSLRRFRGTQHGGSAGDALEALASSPHAASLREIHLPGLEGVAEEAIDGFIASPHLSMLGSVTLHGETEAKVIDRLFRRFGHRLAVSGEHALGALGEADLDPWGALRFPVRA